MLRGGQGELLKRVFPWIFFVWVLSVHGAPRQHEAPHAPQATRKIRFQLACSRAGRNRLARNALFTGLFNGRRKKAKTPIIRVFVGSAAPEGGAFGHATPLSRD